MLKKALLTLPIALAVTGALAAQAPEDVLDRLVTKAGNPAYLTQSRQNRMMMPDNPAYGDADDGEKLFKEKRGPKNASLEECDFARFAPAAAAGTGMQEVLGKARRLLGAFERARIERRSPPAEEASP